MSKCDKCGGTNIWTTVGVFGPEGRCLDCNPPPPDAAAKVAEWMRQIEKGVSDSPQCVENIEHIGPAGRAAIPLLRRVYAKCGTGDFLGCAAKDALRTFEKLNSQSGGAASGTGLAPSGSAPRVATLAGCNITTTCQDFVESALRRKTGISTEFSILPQIIDALREAQTRAYPKADMGKVGGQLEDAFAFTCPTCGELKSSAVLMGAVVKSMQGMNPGMATFFGGPNIANLAGGRCPDCGGQKLDIAYDPRRIRGITPLPEDGKAKSKTGCFIATACCGSADCAEVLILRAFRDETLLSSGFGRSLVAIYYRYSPTVARWIASRPLCRGIVRRLLVDPAVRLVKNCRRG